ncbi:ArnT family glycosyltransferase [Tundrisphaera sp. TA3]|uniref:ArnT family glycosyltransferase n=1 Tax=Tundrisphaera sp. TA3 TaxID=3435775 RepID=UPI003EBFA931
MRGWGLGRLGLTHFDEGIYALAGLWSLSPGGIGAISPGLIPYAPPGFVILVGMAYGVLGASDFAAIAVSQVVGVATIPTVAWVAGRSFGPRAGLAAAALAASSGAHVAFSRMALTDVSFLLAWLVALGAGQMLLERPGPGRAIRLGMAVGLAQQVKYNGWLAGAIVALAALAGLVAEPEERRPSRWLRVFGWGMFAAAVASLVVLPWYRFVENHGGYAGLLRHQRSYLGGANLWPGHLDQQFRQAIALSGGWSLGLAGWGLAAIFVLSAVAGDRNGAGGRLRPILGGVLGPILANLPWWIALGTLPRRIGDRAPGVRLLGVAWAVLAILTPFYHPYARLWLPLHALGWILTAGWMGSVVPIGIRSESGPQPGESSPGRPARWTPAAIAWSVAVCVGCLGSHASLATRSHAIAGLFDPSDSVRLAVDRLSARLPEDVTALDFLGRPSVTFYLGSRIALRTRDGLEAMSRPSGPGIWGLYDSGIAGGPGESTSLPPELDERWEVVASEMTSLSLPTLLDVHPDAPRSEASASAMRRAPLLLLRPRRAGSLR